MKKILFFAVLLVPAGMIWAQAPTKPKTAVKSTKPVTTVANSPAMRTLNDSASYAMGVSLASFYKQQGITTINTTMVSKAINDVIAGRALLMDDITANNVMNKCISDLQESKSKPNIEAGEAYLQANKARPGVKTTASGLQYEVITEGAGEKPQATDSVTVNYMGTLINGIEFDNSYKRGEPITFSLNRVIPGWTEGLQLMSVGAKYKFVVPHSLAYGPAENGPIPGGSTLLFEIELLNIKKVN